MADYSDDSSLSVSEGSSSDLSDDISDQFSASDDEYMDVSSDNDDDLQAVFNPQSPANLGRPRGGSVFEAVAYAEGLCAHEDWVLG